MKAITIGLATGEIGRRSGVGLCGFDYLGSQPQILMPVQTHRPTSEAMPQVRQFFVILLDEEDSRHTPNPFIKIRLPDWRCVCGRFLQVDIPQTF
jgi:hypothetical protein